MGKKVNKKLVKTRGSRIDTVEAMSVYRGCGCTCTYTCDNCSGGGSWKAREFNNESMNSITQKYQL